MGGQRSAAWQVVYCEDTHGASPVLDYICAQQRIEQARILRHIDLLEDLGAGLGFPYSGHMRGKIWELRVRGTLRHRILYSAARARRLVLLNALTESSARVPEREIRVAEARLRDFEDRLEAEGNEKPRRG